VDKAIEFVETSEGRTIPVRFTYTVLESNKKEKTYKVQITSIVPKEKLNEDEMIKEFVIPSILNSENYASYACIVVAISADVFDSGGNGRIGSKAHPIGRLVIDDSIEKINSYAFCKITADTVVWPKSCKIIEHSTFRNASIKNFEGMENVTEIKENAFLSNNVLKSFAWPEKCTDIPDDCFKGCTSLKSITGIQDVTSVGMSALSFCGFEEFEWPEGCQIIPSNCFFGDTKLRQITINGAVSEIENAAFRETALTELDLTNSFVCDVDENAIDAKVAVKMPYYSL
jgi:hypothetical protein